MSTPKTTLFSLPREIRDEIYHLACVAGGDDLFEVQCINSWYGRTRDARMRAKRSQVLDKPSQDDTLRRDAEPELVAPINPLLPMLVNKQIYQEASETYF